MTDETKIRDELVALTRDGIIHAREALEWARIHTNSALHASIEWNKDKASLLYQLSQMRRLIALHVVTPQRERQVIHLTVDTAGGYRRTADVLRAPSLRQHRVDDVRRELKRLRERVRHENLTEFQAVWDAIDALEDDDAQSASA